MKVEAARIITNPLMHYKLDPGEPGMATPTPASRSIAKVATHEATNVRRFKREAMEENGIVLYSYFTLNMKFAGSFLAATSGKSKAFIIIPQEKKSGDKNEIMLTNHPKTDPTENPVSEMNINPPPQNSPDNSITPDDPKQQMQNSDIDKSKNISLIKSKITELEMEKTVLKNQLASQSASPSKNIFSEEQLNQIEKKIAYYEYLNEREKQRQLMEQMAKMFQTQQSAGVQVIALTQSGSTIGQLLDETA